MVLNFLNHFIMMKNPSIFRKVKFFQKKNQHIKLNLLRTHKEENIKVWLLKVLLTEEIRLLLNCYSLKLIEVSKQLKRKF